MGEKKFEISEERLLGILEFMAVCVNETLGLKFPADKKILKCTKTEPCFEGREFQITMIMPCKTKSKPEVWFHLCTSDDEHPDNYIIHDYKINEAPWDTFGRVWSLSGEYAYIKFTPGTDEIATVNWGSEYDLDDNEEDDQEKVPPSMNN
jgi:hypothetical protein